jgi:hypothetical protein
MIWRKLLQMKKARCGWICTEVSNRKRGHSMRLAGSLPVIPTRFYNGKIDFDSLLRLLDHFFPELDGYTSRGALANPRRFCLRNGVS